jgi:acetyl esterase/lipase
MNELSVAARLLPLIMTLRGSKRLYSSAKRTIARAERERAHPKPHHPPRSLGRRVDIRFDDGEWPVYTIAGRRPSGRRVLFAHGGTWIHPITNYHWRLVAELALTTGAEITVPLYPLAPVGTASIVIPRMAEIAAGLVDAAGDAGTTVIGDSAGGTIALAVAQQLAIRGMRPAVVLIAPALDLAFTDPRIAEIAPHDPWLAVPGVRAAARLWAGERDIHDPLVSPLLGSLRGLGPITLFTSLRDIANADARALVRAALGQGVTVDATERPGLLHNYPLLPIPEARSAREKIARVISR